LRGTVPGIGVLAMPKGNIESAALIGAAAAMARKAEIYRAVLIENGLPGDFIQQLDGAGAELKGSLDARGVARAGVPVRHPQARHRSGPMFGIDPLPSESPSRCRTMNCPRGACRGGLYS
jgi:hypothetical protein